MGIIVALISSALCALFYVRMVKREVPEPLTKKQAVTPVVIGLFAPLLATVLVVLFGLAVRAITGGGKLADLIDNLVLRSLAVSFFGAGMTEELIKFLLLLVLVKRLNPKNVYEYALIAAGIGFGFTVLEEIMYGGQNAAAGLLRLPGFAMHMVLGLLMGWLFGLARYNKQNGKASGGYTFLALFLPILWHTAFDASTAFNAALVAEDDYVNFKGLLVGLAVVAVSLVLQIVALVIFKTKTQALCAMELSSSKTGN